MLCWRPRSHPGIAIIDHQPARHSAGDQKGHAKWRQAPSQMQQARGDPDIKSVNSRVGAPFQGFIGRAVRRPVAFQSRKAWVPKAQQSESWKNNVRQRANSVCRVSAVGGWFITGAALQARSSRSPPTYLTHRSPTRLLISHLPSLCVPRPVHIGASHIGALSSRAPVAASLYSQSPTPLFPTHGLPHSARDGQPPLHLRASV